MAAVPQPAFLALWLATLSILGGRGDGRVGDTDSRRTALRRVLQEPSVVPRIANGMDAPCGRFSYMVSLNSRQNIHKCGGVLVYRKWVLTAAHCVDPAFPDSVGAAPIVIIGACNITEKKNDNGVVEIMQPKRTVLHENWTGSIRDGYDVALLKFQKASKHVPVGLPPRIHELPRSSQLLTLGWGMDENGDQQLHLKKADVNLVQRSVCNAEGVWNGLVKDSMVCAFSLRGQDVCQGDSGGPLLQPYIPDGNISDGDPRLDVVVGITSFGDDSTCGYSEKPSVFTSVSRLGDWIEATVKNKKIFSPPAPPSSGSAPELNSADGEPPGATATRPPPPTSPLQAAPLSKKQKKEAARELASALVVFELGGDMDPVKAAIARGADVNAWLDDQGWTALMIAASIGSLELIEVLLQAGARVDGRDVEGGTPLIVASSRGHVDVVVALVEAGADVNAAAYESKFGTTPLLSSSSRLFTMVVKALLAAKADPNKPSSVGETPLHVVSLKLGSESEHIAEALMDFGADLDAREKNGRTPLYEASFAGNLGMVRTLMRRGADPSIRDNKQQGPIDVVCKCVSVGKWKYRRCSSKNECERSKHQKKIKLLLKGSR